MKVAFKPRSFDYVNMRGYNLKFNLFLNEHTAFVLM